MGRRGLGCGAERVGDDSRGGSAPAEGGNSARVGSDSGSKGGGCVGRQGTIPPNYKLQLCSSCVDKYSFVAIEM
jgi:hypothetical protein